MKNVMTYKGYAASMELDADDHILVGRVLDVDDIITFHGESVPEFEAAFHYTVDEIWPHVKSSDRTRKSPPPDV